LARLIVVKLRGLIDYRFSSALEVLHVLGGRVRVELVNLGLNLFNSRVLLLIAPELSDELALVREVELFVRLDVFPVGLKVESKSIHRDIFISRFLQKERVWGSHVKSLSQFAYFSLKILLAVDLMRQKRKFKVEEVLSLGVFELLWLVNFCPDVVYVLTNRLHDVLFVALRGEIS